MKKKKGWKAIVEKKFWWKKRVQSLLGEKKLKKKDENIFGENIFGENLLGENIFGENLFRWKKMENCQNGEKIWVKKKDEKTSWWKN